MVSFERAQRLSETRKKGVPPSHDRAEANVRAFLVKYLRDIAIERKWKQNFDDAFIQFHQLHKNKQKTFFGHEYDLMVRDIVTGYPIFVIEIGDIGDDSKHNLGHEEQLINDGIAKNWIESRYPLTKFVRINKDETYYH